MKMHTPLRKAILSLLNEHHLLTAPALLERLSTQGMDVNKTSVYRALETLLKQREISRTSFGQNDILYELASNHHDHWVCTTCGRVEEMACVTNLPAPAELTVEHHQVTLYGTCQNCTSSN
jgi:Fe2+ or Zn2+ uptake regulation protein